MRLVLLALILLLGTSATLRAAADSTRKGKERASKDYKVITHHLCDSLVSDRSKAEAVYHWITANVAYDVYGLEPGVANNKDPNSIIREGKAVCEGYSILFAAMCTEAGIRTINIVGYTKDLIFDKGDKLYIPRHMWSALLIDGRWLMTDATWGAGYIEHDTTWWRKLVSRVSGRPVHKINTKFVWQYSPKWLLQDPLEFRYTHLPAFAPFQFADTAMPLSVFEAGDSAIKAFNAISHSVNNSDELMELSHLSDSAILYKYAASLYAFNDRFALAAAVDYNRLAREALDAMSGNVTVPEYKARIDTAYALIENSGEMIYAQSALIREQYAALNRKNLKKYSDAMEYFRDLGSLSRRSASTIMRYKRIADIRYFRQWELPSKYRVNASEMHKMSWGLNNSDVDQSVTKQYDSLYAVVTDSIIARKKRLMYLTGDESVLSRIAYYINDGNEQLNSLLQSLDRARFLLTNESYYRLYLQDNLDDSAGSYYHKMQKLKDIGIDSVQTRYLECFDSVFAFMHDCVDIQREQLHIHHLIEVDLESVAAIHSPDSSLFTTYRLWTNYTAVSMDRIAAAVDASLKFIDRLSSNANEIRDGYAFITRVAKAMQRMEKIRRDKEQKAITVNQQLDVYDIATNRQNVRITLSALEAAKRKLR